MIGISGLRRLAILTALLAAVLAAPARLAGAEDDDESGGAKFSPEAAATFNKRCTACHTFGRGIKVGPDLKGVTQRRERPWLHKFIHSSSTVISSGDRTATALFAQFKQQRMPDWVDLTDKQIDDILDYLAMAGPEIKPADERNAEIANAAEVEHGRRLFFGEVQSKYGAQACATCHAIEGGGMRNGSLGPNLTGVYEKYQDQALTAFLRKPCFQWEQRTATHYLTPKESFAMKAFLRDRSLHRSATTTTSAHIPLSADATQPSGGDARGKKRGTNQ